MAERAGARSWEIAVEPGATVGSLLAGLQARFAWLREVPVAVARNQSLARSDERIAPGDELALLPPVSGG